MSSTTPSAKRSTEAEKTQIGEMIVVRAAPGIHNVANYEHGSDNVNEHTYSVTAEHGCSCPAAKYHDGLCKHEQAVLDADDLQVEDNEPSITGPHTGFNAYGQADHHYFRCERCGLETTDDALASRGCWRCSESIGGQ